MKVISSAELRNNMKKYLDLAKTEKIGIQRGKDDIYILSGKNAQDEDTDLERAITLDELFVRIKEDIHEIFNKKANR